MSGIKLEDSNLMKAFSDYGKTAFLPQGIFYWSGRAKEEAEINATIGTAWARLNEFTDSDSDKLSVVYLPTLYKTLADGLTPAEIFPYAPIEGLPEFRKLWKRWLLKKAGADAGRLENNITLPVVAPGITGALYLMIRFFLSPGESILFSDRRWGNYNNVVKLNAGVQVKTFEFFAEGDFNVDACVEGVEACLAEQGKAVVALNFPNNPTGFSPSQSVEAPLVEGLARVAASGRGPVVVLIDDAYEGYVYDDEAMGRSIFYKLAGADPNLTAVKLDAVSKEFFWYGGRTGAITFHLAEGVGAELEESLMNKLSALIRSTVSNCPRLVQSAMIHAFDGLDKLEQERETVRRILARRWRLMTDRAAELGDWGGHTLLPSNSGFFSFVDVAGPPADKVADHLLKKYKTGVVAQTGAGNGLRLGFCGVPEDQISAMIENVHAALSDLS